MASCIHPILGSAVVTPANATNADKVMITSDDPDGTIAYYTNGEKAYIPKQAGTVTFTATIEDTNPQTGETKTVSGDSTVTFVYKNNVKTVELAEENKNMTVEAGKSVQCLHQLSQVNWMIRDTMSRNRL